MCLKLLIKRRIKIDHELKKHLRPWYETDDNIRADFTDNRGNKWIVLRRQIHEVRYHVTMANRDAGMGITPEQAVWHAAHISTEIP